MSPPTDSSTHLSTPCGIGSLPFPFPLFPPLDTLFSDLVTDSFWQLSTWERLQSVFCLLLKQIDKTPEPTFLLPAVVSYIERVNALQVVDLPVSFALFEFWLNHFSRLSSEQQAQVRGKIVGKYLPREEYGCVFPISLGKVHSGSHFISAHLSPDLDTTVASFIGWMDAFAARLGTGQHLWNLPGGPSQEQIATLFTKWFGPSVFSILSHTEGAMRLSAMDLLTTDSILYAEGARTLTHLDHNMGNRAILYVDAEGYYHGDWRGSNFEPVQQITTLFDRLLRSFAHTIHVDLLALFAEEEPPEMVHFYAKSFSKTLECVLDAVEADSPYQQRLDLFCKKVLLLENGLLTSFQELFTCFHSLGISQVSKFLKEVEELDVLSVVGRKLFRLLHRLVHSLDQAVDAISRYVDRLDVVMSIKHDVLGYQPSCAALRSDLETLRLSIGERDYLTVVLVDEEGRRTPLGVVLATTLRKTILGTVSQRDFSNPDEMRMAPYLTVISVMDHHKSAIETRTPIQAMIADVQSCNVLVAEQSFLLNDRYGSGGISLEQMHTQLKSCMEACSKSKGKGSAQERRLLERLLRKQSALDVSAGFYIHPLREYLEYFYCLHAILDDTDLLSKVGMRDVQCVASLLNRLKTLCTGVETEVISLDDLAKTSEGAKCAAQRLLESPDLHALYMALYAQREQEVEHALRACVLRGDLTLFSDTKQQNGCCRIGQIKLFQGNQSTYTKDANALLKRWLDESQRVAAQDPQCDLHLMMVSTLESRLKQHEVNAEVNEEAEAAEDGLWIWAAPTTMGMDHLTRFLSAFQHLPVFQQHPPRVTLYGTKSREWQELFTQNFRITKSIQVESKEESRTYAIVQYSCGLVNSRKTMISPFLPPLVGGGPGA